MRFREGGGMGRGGKEFGTLERIIWLRWWIMKVGRRGSWSGCIMRSEYEGGERGETRRQFKLTFPLVSVALGTLGVDCKKR